MLAICKMYLKLLIKIFHHPFEKQFNFFIWLLLEKKKNKGKNICFHQNQSNNEKYIHAQDKYLRLKVIEKPKDILALMSKHEWWNSNKNYFNRNKSQRLSNPIARNCFSIFLHLRFYNDIYLIHKILNLRSKKTHNKPYRDPKAGFLWCL